MLHEYKLRYYVTIFLSQMLTVVFVYYQINTPSRKTKVSRISKRKIILNDINFLSLGF